MPTVPELREMAKAKGIVGVSKMVKAELEEKLGLEVTAKPRAAKLPAKKTLPVKKSPPRKEGDMAKLIRLEDNDVITTYIIPFSEIKDFDKLKSQIARPFSQREEADPETKADYVEVLMLEKAQDVVEDSDVYEVKDGQRIVYTATVDCTTLQAE